MILNCEYNLTHARAEITYYVPVSGEDPFKIIRDENPPVF